MSDERERFNSAYDSVPVHLLKLLYVGEPLPARVEPKRHSRPKPRSEVKETHMVSREKDSGANRAVPGDEESYSITLKRVEPINQGPSRNGPKVKGKMMRIQLNDSPRFSNFGTAPDSPVERDLVYFKSTRPNLEDFLDLQSLYKRTVGVNKELQDNLNTATVEVKVMSCELRALMESHKSLASMNAQLRKRLDSALAGSREGDLPKKSRGQLAHWRDLGQKSTACTRLRQQVSELEVYKKKHAAVRDENADLKRRIDEIAEMINEVSVPNGEYRAYIRDKLQNAALDIESQSLVLRNRKSSTTSNILEESLLKRL